MKGVNFSAIIKSTGVEKGGSYVEFPGDVATTFGHAGRIKVFCYFDGIEYRGSLVRMGTECHIVGIPKEILKKINKKAGDTIAVTIREDTEERIIKPHPILEEVLVTDKTLRSAYERLSFTKKKELNVSLESAKKSETLERRITSAMEALRQISASTPSMKP